MGAAVFFGCTFVAFGPAFALFLITVAGDPLRVIILVAGAFFWLVSLLLASVVWFILVHVTDPSDARLQYGLLIFGAAVSVLLQEMFRFAYYKLLKKADEGLASLSEDGRSPISIRQMAYVSGLSFGIISGVFSVINILADALGPGVVGIHGDSPYYFLTSAFLTAAIILLHTFWGVVFFDACERRRYWTLGLVVGSHLLTSGLTFLNPWYEASLLPIYAVTVSMGLWAFITAGGSLRSIQRSLSYAMSCSAFGSPTILSVPPCSPDNPRHRVLPTTQSHTCWALGTAGGTGDSKMRVGSWGRPPKHLSLFSQESLLMSRGLLKGLCKL
ncbi:gamma-secretase subunit APH-1A isoform X1 [Myotis daubentonii]|nr:gamma-secretase subunit APH-1A isoform X1 [Myotis daubentonii]